MVQLGKKKNAVPHSVCLCCFSLEELRGWKDGKPDPGAPAWSWSSCQSTEVESTQEAEFTVVTSARPPGPQTFKVPQTRPQNPKQKFPELLERVQPKPIHLLYTHRAAMPQMVPSPVRPAVFTPRLARLPRLLTLKSISILFSGEAKRL